MSYTASECIRQKRQFWVILTIVFFGFVGISMPYLIFPPLFLHLEYSFLPASWGESSRALLLGITLAVYPLGQFMGSPILGSLSDEYGRKPLLSASLVVSAFCNLLTGIAIARQQLGLLIISRLMAGFMEGNIAIARAMCADLKTLSKHETFGKTNAVASIAYLLGPFLGGVMTGTSLFGMRPTATPFFFVSVLFLFQATLASLVLQSSVATALAKTRTLWQRFNFVARLTTLFKNKRLKSLLIVSTCFTLAVDIFYEFGPVYLTIKWELGPTQLILYNAVVCIGLAIGNGWLPVFVSSRVSNRLAILISMGGIALLFPVLVFLESHVTMLLGFALSGVLIGLANTLLTVKISDSAPDGVQGEVMGTQVSLRVLGDGIICLFGGVLLIFSPKIILVVASFISVIAMLYYRSVRRLV